MPRSDPSAAGLIWTVPKRLRVHSGGDISTIVSWKNVGKTVVSYEGGDPISGVVTAVGGRRILARSTGISAGVGHTVSVRHGRTDQVRGQLSTASCDPSLGYALPPGKYSVRFVFDSFQRLAGGGSSHAQLVSNPIPLTITNDTPPPLPESKGELSKITLP